MQEMYCPEQLIIKINALYLAIFPAYKIDHLISGAAIKPKRGKGNGVKNNLRRPHTALKYKTPDEINQAF